MEKYSLLPPMSFPGAAILLVRNKDRGHAEKALFFAFFQASGGKHEASAERESRAMGEARKKKMTPEINKLRDSFSL